MCLFSQNLTSFSFIKLKIILILSYYFSEIFLDRISLLDSILLNTYVLYCELQRNVQIGGITRTECDRKQAATPTFQPWSSPKTAGHEGQWKFIEGNPRFEKVTQSEGNFSSFILAYWPRSIKYIGITKSFGVYLCLVCFSCYLFVFEYFQLQQKNL